MNGFDGDPRPARGARQRVLYGRRKGRPLRKQRQKLLVELLPRLRVDLMDTAPGGLDPRSLFTTMASAPHEVWLEVGFGGGEHFCAQAEAHPEIGLIGCEPFINGVAAALKGIAVSQLTNVRLFTDDAHILIDAFKEASLARVFVLFPDPWPKARHAKRRFISGQTLDALARVMAPGALLHVASDDPGMIRWALSAGLAHPGFDWIAERAPDWCDRPRDQPPTRYEEKARERGIRPVFLAFRRRG
ncbi:MAG: tRNA (guanine-N7-)-methyltransferase [Alphaproteobacteria bacterium]|jgi:tRNA (guanine-N7-)-methyltransferase